MTNTGQILAPAAHQAETQRGLRDAPTVKIHIAFVSTGTSVALLTSGRFQLAPYDRFCMQPIEITCIITGHSQPAILGSSNVMRFDCASELRPNTRLRN